MQAVQRHHEVDVAGGREVLAAGQVDGHVSDVGEPLAGRCHRPFGHVVALVGGGGEGLGEQLEGQSGAATDVHDPGSGREATGHAVQQWDHRRDEQGPRHRCQHRLGVLLGPLALVVVGQAQAGPERLHQPVRHPRIAQAGEHAGGIAGLVLAGQHQGRLRLQLEGLSVTGDQQLGRRLAPEPLAQPPLVESRGHSQVNGGDCSGAVQRPVDAEAHAEVDHEAHHLALLVPPGGQRVPTQQVTVYGHRRHFPSVMPRRSRPHPGPVPRWRHRVPRTAAPPSHPYGPAGH